MTKYNIKTNKATGAETFFYVSTFMWVFSIIVISFTKKDVLEIKPEL